MHKIHTSETSMSPKWRIFDEYYFFDGDDSEGSLAQS